MGVLSWILLAACMLWSALRFLPAGREAHMPTMPYMIALIRFLWIPYLVIAVWAGLVGSWWQCGVAVAGIVSILAMQVPYWTNMPRERWHHQRGTSHETASDDHRQTARSADAEPTANPPQASGDTYHLMTLNCRYGKASADAIIAAVRERHIDVLALQELSTDLIKRLERGGLHRILPYRQLGTPREKTDNGGFNGIWSRTKPKRGTHGIVSIPAADVPGIMLQTDDGTSVAFASAHTKSPMRGCREWSDGIRSLSALVPMPRKSVSAGTGREERATGSKAGRGGGSAYSRRRYRGAHGRPQRRYRPCQLPRAAAVRIPRRRTGTGSRTCQYLPQSGAVAAHRARPHHGRDARIRVRLRRRAGTSRRVQRRRIIRRGRHRPPRADRHNDYLSGMPHGQHSGYASLSAPTVTERGHTHSDAPTKPLQSLGFRVASRCAGTRSVTQPAHSDAE